MAGRKIALLNNAEITYKKDGIKFTYNHRSTTVLYSDPAKYPYFSLILLSAQEESLDRAIEIINAYKTIPVIREIIIVGNETQNTADIKKNSRIKFIINKKYNSPIITSVKYGLFCASKFTNFAIIVPVSKEQIDKKQLEKAMRIVWKRQIDFSVPIVNNERMHPIIVKHTEFVKIKKIRKEQGLKYFSKTIFKEVLL